MKYAESTCERIERGNVTLNVRHWGPRNAPMLFMLHGWMDCSVTFQFIADALCRSFRIVAPDLRGYGLSAWLGRPYWFVEYYADLDALLAHYAPEGAVLLAGHSMGANIACNYAAARPERVERLALLDFLGLTPRPDDDASTQLRTWLDACVQRPTAKPHTNVEAFAARLRTANPRLDAQRAYFLARNMSVELEDGRVAMACDPWNRLPSPYIYHVGDWLSAWRRVCASVLLLVADQGEVRRQFGRDDPEYLRRLACFEHVRVVELHDCGHNVQHDRPEEVAAELATFFAR